LYRVFQGNTSVFAPGGIWVDVAGLAFTVDASHAVHYLVPKIQTGYGAQLLPQASLQFIWSNEGHQGLHWKHHLRTDPDWAIYDDSSNFATIGRGHLVTKAKWEKYLSAGDRWVIDASEANALNSYDIEQAQMSLERTLRVPWNSLSSGEAAALIDYTFQHGSIGKGPFGTLVKAAVGTAVGSAQWEAVSKYLLPSGPNSLYASRNIGRIQQILGLVSSGSLVTDLNYLQNRLR
jgi:GH24 family phage-related lysozyme (muramidase)